MRLILFCDTVLQGGTLNVLAYKAIGLTKRGHSVTTVLLDDPKLDDTARCLKEAGILVIRGKFGNRNILWNLRSLSGFLSRGSYEAALVDFPMLTSGKLIPLLLRLRGVPKVIGVIHLPIAAENQSPLFSFLHVLTKYLNVGLLDKIVCVSDSVREEVLRNYRLLRPERVSVIENGIPDVHGKWAKRGALDLKDDDFVVCITAMLVNQKGHRYLIDALSSLLGKIDHLVVLFLGDGPLRGQLEDFCAQRGLASTIRFLGFVKNPIEVMSCADLFVLPSLLEGMPLSVMEASSLGLPIVATSVLGIKDIVQDGENGLLVAPCDHEALAGAILRMYADGTTRKRLGICAREEFLRRFELGKMVDRYEHLLLDVFSKSRQ